MFFYVLLFLCFGRVWFSIRDSCLSLSLIESHTSAAFFPPVFVGSYVLFVHLTGLFVVVLLFVILLKCFESKSWTLWSTSSPYDKSRDNMNDKARPTWGTPYLGHALPGARPTCGVSTLPFWPQGSHTWGVDVDLLTTGFTYLGCRRWPFDHRVHIPGVSTLTFWPQGSHTFQSVDYIPISRLHSDQ
jgi:hypothetical protein